jgi:DNA-binding beta-propeller fold protein YncE
MRLRRRGLLAALAFLACLGGLALLVRRPQLARRIENRLDRFLARTLDGPLPDGRYLYTARDGALYVYDISAGHRLAGTLLNLPIHYPRGIAAHTATGRLWVSHHGDPFPTPKDPRGQVLCLDLRTHRVLWNRTYIPGIDSVQVTPDGQRLYFGYGEAGARGGWIVINAATGDEIQHIPFVPGTHNLIIPPAGNRAYLTSLKHRMLALLDTNTNTIEREVGPFSAGIRPIAVNRAQTLFFAAVDFLSGFQVADLATGKVIHTVQVQGYRSAPMRSKCGLSTRTTAACTVSM